MRYVTALLSGLLIFLCVWFLSGLILVHLVPHNWWDTEIGFGLMRGNIPSIIAAILAAIAATHTFRASLHSKSGRLYKKMRINDDK